MPQIPIGDNRKGPRGTCFVPQEAHIPKPVELAFIPSRNDSVHSASSRPYLWMLAGSFSFAVMAVLANAAGQMCEWQFVALSRCLLVMVIVGCIAAGSGAKLVLWRPRTLWMRSIAGSVSLVGSFYALTRMDIATVLTLTNMFPIWVAFLSWPMLGVWPTGRVWAAVVTGVAGVYFIQHPQSEGPSTALIVALACSLSTAVAMLGLHRLQGIDPRAIVVHFAGVATLFCIATFFLFDRTPGTLPWWDWRPLLLLLGIGVTATIGQLFLTKAFATGDPAKVSVVSLTQVVFAFAFQILLAHPIEARTILGMVLILLPTAWVMRKTG
jgi:drug/metabolite transporter (DMT)-like permease